MNSGQQKLRLSQETDPQAENREVHYRVPFMPLVGGRGYENNIIVLLIDTKYLLGVVFNFLETCL